jgi:outer membrane protein assembly factor BamB
MSDDSDTGGTTEMTEVSTNTYEGTITDLSADEYHQGVAVRGTETVSFDVEGVTVEENNVDTEEVDLSSGDTDITTIIEDNAQEVIGFSDVHELTVTVADVDELAQKWSVDRSGRLQHSTPAVNNEFVFVGGLDDSLVSIWRNTGDADWTFDRLGALSDSSPLLANGSLYIGSGGGTFYSLDPGTGGSNWQVQLDSAITSSPASMNGTVYFASNDGMLHAVDTSGASGTLQNTTWSVDVGGPVYSDVAAANGMIYVTTNDGDVVAVDDTGTEQWRVKDGAEFGASSPVYHNGSLYVGGQSVWRLDPSDGSLIWDTGYSGNVGSSPVVDNGVVFIGDASGTVMTLNVSDGGTTLWNTQTANGVATTPGLTSDRVITGGLGGRVHVFDRANGDVIASKDLGAPIRSSPVVDNDVIYIGTEAGTLFALQNIP